MTFAVRRAREHLGRLALVALVVALVAGGIGAIDAAADRMLSIGAERMLADAEPAAQSISVQALQAADAAEQDAAVRAAIDDAFGDTEIAVARQAALTGTVRDGAGATATLQLLDDPRIPDLAALAAGAWPAAPGQIALPVAAAERLNLSLGDGLTLAVDDAPLTLVGTWMADDPSDAVWRGDPSVVSGESDGVVGPAVVAEGALDSIPDTSTLLWQITPVTAGPADIPHLQRAVRMLPSLPDTIDPQRQRSTRVIGELAATLQRQSAALAATRGLLIAPQLIIALLGALVLGIVLGTLSTARGEELALVRARGASRRRLGFDAGLEAGAAALIGAMVALLALLATLNTITPVALLAAVGAVLLTAIMAAIMTARSAGRADAVRGESLRSDAGARALPALLLPAAVAAALAALATWQLFGTRAVVRADGSADPLAASAPALLLVAGCALAPVVAAPLAALLERMLRRTRGIAPILPLRQTARRIGTVAVAILCLALAAASVALAVTAPAASAAAGQRNRTAQLGADVRMVSDDGLDVTAATVEGWDGVTDAAELLRTPLTAGSDMAVIVAGPARMLGLTEPLPTAQGASIPTAVTSSFAVRLGADEGTVFSARIRGYARPVQFEVRRVVDALPGVGAGFGAAVDPEALQEAGVELAPNELWVRTADTDAVAAELRAHAAHPVRVLTAAQVTAAPVTSTAPVLLAVGALIAAVLGVVGFLAATSAANRSRRGEAFVLRALGLRPAHRRTLRAGETVAVAGYAVIAGGAVGVIVAALVLPLFLAVGA